MALSQTSPEQVQPPVDEPFLARLEDARQSIYGDESDRVKRRKQFSAWAEQAKRIYTALAKVQPEITEQLEKLARIDDRGIVPEHFWVNIAKRTFQEYTKQDAVPAEHLSPRVRAALLKNIFVDAATLYLLEAESAKSRLDTLTGIPARKMMEFELSKLFKNTEHALVFYGVDLDVFKEMNDEFGHPVGDQILRGLAQRMQNFCKAYTAAHGDELRAIAARWGGDEFALAFEVKFVDGTHNPSAQEISNLTAHIQRDVFTESLRIYFNYKGVESYIDYNPAATLGAIVSEKGGKIDDIVDRADRVMYAGKRPGRRDHVVLPTPVPVGGSAPKPAQSEPPGNIPAASPEFNIQL